MNKRALMLTAAAAALLSGQAYAATSPCNSSTSTTASSTSAQLCDITTEVTSPINTGTVNPDVSTAIGGLGNVTIDTNGLIVIGTNPPAAPVVTINSGTTAAPTTVINTTNIDYTGINATVGVLLEEASVPTSATLVGTSESWTGEFENLGGTIDLLGAGTNKVGVLVAGGAYYNQAAAAASTSATPVSSDTAAWAGVYANIGYNGTAFTPLGAFTGVVPTGGGDPVAIYLTTGSTTEIQGTASYGIYLIGATYPQAGSTAAPSGGATLIGDIDIGGTLAMTPTSYTTTPTGNVAVYIAGWEQANTGTVTPNPALAGTPYAGDADAMIGNIDIISGGIVSSAGQGAEGVVIIGAVRGGFINSGELETLGTPTPSTSVGAGDPEGGCALCVANNITGGIFNNGVTVNPTGATNAAAVISESGTAPAIDISPQVNSASNYPVSIEIGKVGIDLDYSGQFSLLNRGSISAVSEDPNLTTNAINIAGETDWSVTLDGGIFNSGSISVIAGSNTQSSTTSVSAIAIDIGNYATIGTGAGGTGGMYSLINTNETGGGTISASVSGPETGSAYAIYIAPAAVSGSGATFTSIFNSGTIIASASTTTLTEGSIAAYAIEDRAGTLTNIVNEGTIEAEATELDDNAQVNIAIDTSANLTKSVTILDQATANGPATIVGDIRFGAMPGTLTIKGTSQTDYALVTGNLSFDDTLTTANDTLTVGSWGTFSGEIAEKGTVGSVDIDIAANGTLDLLTSLATNLNATVSTSPKAGTPLSVGNLVVESGGVLLVSVSQDYNVDAFPGIAIINAKNITIGDAINNVSPLQIAFGSFVASPGIGGASEFVLLSSPQGGNVNIAPSALDALETSIETGQANQIPFLFTGGICTYGITGAAVPACSGAEPINSGNTEVVLTLTPKTPEELGLTGFALKMFPYANQALVNDNTLGAAVITDIRDTQEAQAAYASFAPDVSGANRAIAISLTDSATNIVAARQRALRMYANQEGDTTLWGQQFGERLSQANTGVLTGYNDSGFGFALGVDEGDKLDGRYGGAFTFFSGGMSQKEPTSAKTASEYYLLTGYTDWRGKGLFVDSQFTVGYGNLKGKRYITLTDPDNGATVSREADGDRPTELLAGGLTTGGVFTAGGTVFMPQVSVDGLTLREEGYTESNGGDGFNLHVQPYYADSLRAFIGADVRQDVNFGDFYIQPELRAGYRYDFLDGGVKLKANFASVGSANDQAYDPFTIEGPDPGHGNIVLGGGLATTTGAWSIGITYDFVRAGDGPTEQTGLLTLLGRI